MWGKPPRFSRLGSAVKQKDWIRWGFCFASLCFCGYSSRVTAFCSVTGGRHIPHGDGVTASVSPMQISSCTLRSCFLLGSAREKHIHYCGRWGGVSTSKESGLFPSKTQEWALVQHPEINFLRRHTCWQRKRHYREGVPRGESRRTARPRGSQPSGLWWLGRFPTLANRSDSGSFLLVLCITSRMDFREGDSGRLVGHMDRSFLSPFDCSWILPVGGSLLVLHSLPQPPI